MLQSWTQVPGPRPIFGAPGALYPGLARAGSQQDRRRRGNHENQTSHGGLPVANGCGPGNEALRHRGDNPSSPISGFTVLQSAPIFLCVLAISVGQVLFKLAAARVDASTPRALAASVLMNPPLITALAVYGLATLAWVWLLRDRSLSASYPLFALSFVMVAVMGRVFLGEALSLPVLAGTSLVVAGVVVITTFQ